MTFVGAMTAIITPFCGGRVDESAFRRLIAWQISCGIDAIVTCGTTGEAATVTPAERQRLIEIAVEESTGRVPIIAGTGSNNTEIAIRQARSAKEAGADAHLSVTPYYNKPTQEGLYQHFSAIAAAVDLPMILYNVPGRTAVNMLPETVARLAHINAVVGLKEACGGLAQVRKVAELVSPSFTLLSGEDAQNVDIYAAGGQGCISVTANVVPTLVARIWDLFQAGKKQEALHEQEKLQELNRAMFLETNPIPAKTALALMDRCAEEFRLPLTPIGDSNRVKLKETLKTYHLL